MPATDAAMTDLAPLVRAGPVATLTMSRPRQRNALSVDLLAAMHASVDAVHAMCAHGDGPRVLVLTGAAPAFCAGMDLKQVVIDAAAGGSGDPELPYRLLLSLAELTLKLRGLPCVVLASMGGPAIGGGCGLVCVADVAITFGGNTLGFPEVDLGLCPAVVAPWVVRKVGPGRARAMLLRGGTMTAEQAHAVGLVDALATDAAGLTELTARTAERLAQGGPVALAATKRLLNAIDGSADGELVRRGARLSADVLATPAAQGQLTARLAASRP